MNILMLWNFGILILSYHKVGDRLSSIFGDTCDILVLWWVMKVLYLVLYRLFRGRGWNSRGRFSQQFKVTSFYFKKLLLLVLECETVYYSNFIGRKFPRSYISDQILVSRLILKRKNWLMTIQKIMKKIK